MFRPSRAGLPVASGLAAGLAFFAGLACFAACGGGGGGSPTFSGPPGVEFPKPGGGTFFLDEHRGGTRSRLHLLESAWGRLVNVHALDADGTRERLPAFRDMLIAEFIQTDGNDYLLETSPITQRTQLVILRQRESPEFAALLAHARANLGPLVAKPDDGSSAGPFSLVARNACLSLRFDDLLEDGPEARLGLKETVRLLTGYPPSTPFSARILFDPNFGGTSADGFHSTRVLIDLNVSGEDSAASPFPVEVNPLGLPASAPGEGRPNASLHLPTRLDPGSGQFRLLTNLSGSALDSRQNGPVDTSSPSVDVVRALRAGRPDDENNGFLLDLNPPQLLGAWPATVEDAQLLPSDDPGFDVRLDLRFNGVCRRAPLRGDVIQVGEHLAEVTEDRPTPDSTGRVAAVPARVIGTLPITDVEALRGGASFLTIFSLVPSLPFTCWASVQPPPGLPPDQDLDADSRLVVRFSEAMSPGSMDPFESLRLVRGAPGTLISSNVVVADAQAAEDLRSYTLRPQLPLSDGFSGQYHLDLVSGPGLLTDLAGNRVGALPGALIYQLAPDQGVPANAGIVMRFASLDELEPIGPPDLRGQFFFDEERGVIRGRDPVSQSHPVDQGNPVLGLMTPFPMGVQTPLSGLGSKLQTVWRHSDLAWQVEDSSKHNMDVVGLSWTPAGGTVLNDFFERFEIRLAHSRRLPDEWRNFNGVAASCSGLGAGVNMCAPCLTSVPFEDNILRDPRSPQRTVHDRALGYRIDSRDLFVGVTGTRLMPFPINRVGGPFVSYTWRDTAILAKNGEDSEGIPLRVETSDPLAVERPPAGRIAIGGRVPAWGLPLLIEVRCFPSTSALGLNPLEIYLANNAQQLPNMRAYSTGGIDESRTVVQINPDLAFVPQGGYNPGSRPPGKPTAWQADNSFYPGQLDTVIRVSRVHSAWIASAIPDAHFLPPIVFPRPGEQPGDTRVELEFRGAAAFLDEAQTDAFDASRLDPLGDVGFFQVEFYKDDPTWTADISKLDGAPYVQLRITFVNDIRARLAPELSAIGISLTAR